MTANMAQPIGPPFLRSRLARRRIAAVTAACALVALAYGLLAPRWYQSVLTVVPVKAQKSGGISALLGGEIGGLAAGLDTALGGGADAARIAAVLQSTAVTDAVVEKFDLRTRYAERYQEGAREELWRHCAVKVMPKPNLVEFSCEDKDPQFAQQMAGYFATYGNEVFRRVGVSSASEEVRFLEKRVAELRAQADEAANRMREFQEKHQIVDLDTQARAVVSSVASLYEKRLSKELELDYARTFASGDEAGTRQLRSQLSIVDEKLRDLELPREQSAPGKVQGQSAASKGTGMFPAALAVPGLRAEFEKLYRDRKVAEATLLFSLDRLEGAKAAEARDVSTFVVLDPPTVPTRKSRPKRLVILALATLVGLAASVLFEWWRSGGPAALLGGLGGQARRPPPPPGPQGAPRDA